MRVFILHLTENISSRLGIISGLELVLKTIRSRGQLVLDDDIMIEDKERILGFYELSEV